MEAPALALIPSGVKAGKVYSVLPSDGVGDFDFTRASTATRINSQGLIETVASNVPRLDYSNGDCPSLLLEPQSTNLYFGGFVDNHCSSCLSSFFIFSYLVFKCLINIWVSIFFYLFLW